MDDRAERQNSERRARVSADLLEEAKRVRGRLLRGMALAVVRWIAMVSTTKTPSEDTANADPAQVLPNR